MTEPKRLFDSGTPLERSILGFGRDEAPSEGLARKTLSAMAAAPSASAAEEPPRASSWARPRWIVAGACALGLAAVVVGFTRSEDARAPAPPPAPPVMPAETPVVNPPAPSEDTPKDEAVVTPDSLPSAPVRSATATGPASAPVRPAAPVAAAPASSASIAREVELLDTVKAKLGANDAIAAARALDAYDSEFPSGTLRPEATVLRIRALLLRGDRSGAEKVAQQFLAKHPSGVHAKRVRSLLADPPPAAP